jgi:hypothetical protein
MSVHKIKQLHFKLKVSDETGSLMLQKQLSQLFYQQLLPVIEQVLEQFDQRDEVICIEKLELDLGKLSLEQLPQEWVMHTQVQLQQKLTEVFNQTEHSQLQRYSQQQRQWQLLEYYCLHGALPWWAEQQNMRQVWQELWQNEPEKLARNINNWTQQDSMLLYRLKNLLDAPTFFRLDKLQNGQDNISVAVQTIALLQQLQTRHLEHVSAQKLSQQLHWLALTRPEQTHALLQRLVIPGQPQGVVNLLSLFADQATWFLWLQQLSIDGLNVLITAYRQISPQVVASNINTKEQRACFWQQALIYVFKHNQTSIAEGELANTLAGFLLDKSKGKEVSQSVTQQFSNWQGAGKNTAITAPEIYISNAGLVLLWSFLPALFERLRLLDNKQLTRPELAVLLMHYLVQPEVPLSEHELLLNKFLCGVELSHPVSVCQQIEPEQQQALDELLKAVLLHWSALNKVSVGWLREVFLSRDGLLTKNGQEWQLQIEGAAADVLLNKLPWSISTIKLPWMPQPLTVQWAY